jgi:transposase
MHLLADGSGNPIAITTTQANASERLQVNILIKKVPISAIKNMTILEADKGYDCFWLRNNLLNMNIFPLIPYRKNNHKSNSFKEMFTLKSKRWKVERTFSWLKRKCRRLLMRWERKFLAWKAFTILGLVFMWLENLVR